MYLLYFVFRKDYNEHKSNPLEPLDEKKTLRRRRRHQYPRLCERARLVDAGADVLCIDSSEGFSEWQAITSRLIRENYGDSVKVGAGNVVDREGFRFLADAGADFVKIESAAAPSASRENRRASAAARRLLSSKSPRQETNILKKPEFTCRSARTAESSTTTISPSRWRWAPTSSCWAATSRFDESPTRKVNINGSYMKEYWGEGSSRARNWRRYDMGGDKKLSFEEGVDSYVPYAGASTTM